MVIYQGYCRPLKQKVDFTVDTVECLETKKGQKWVVKGVHEGHKITTFTNKATGESLMEQLGITKGAEKVIVFDAEEAVIEAPNHEDVAEEIEVFDAEEVVLEAPKIEHEGLTSKHYRKDGTLDMRYKICREIARGMKAESFEEIVEEDVEREMDAESLEDYTPEELATSNVNVGDITVDAGKGGYGAETFDTEMSCPLATQDVAVNTKNRNLTIEKFGYGPLNVDEPGDFWKDIAEKWNTTVDAAKKSKCGNCVAFDESPRMKDCMPGKTSDGEGTLGYCWMHHFKCHSARTCDTWAKGGPITENKVSMEWQEKAFGDSMDAESFDAETYNRVYKAEPNAIIFEEHIPPEVWNNMGPDAQGHYLSTRDESLLIAPCCGVTKAELRMDENANAECGSCCYSGDDFHRRWWVNKPVPTVRAKLEAETVEQESLNPNTVVVPRFVYYKMMMHLPPNVSITQTDDGLSMIIGFHNQDAKMIEALVESYTPDMDGSDVEDTLRIDDDLSIVPSVYYPEESMDFDAEVFNVELQEWGEQEMKTHGKNISFKDWLDEESETHGDMPLVEWAKDEEKSHDERYEADTKMHPDWCSNCGLKDDGCINLGYGDWYCMNFLDNRKTYDGRYDKFKGEEEDFEAEERPASYMVGSDVHELGNATDKLERLTDSEKEYPEWWKSRLSVATDEVDGLADYLDYAEDSGAIDRLQSEPARKVNRTLVGLLGLGALGAFLAPEQIRALFKKLK